MTFKARPLISGLLDLIYPQTCYLCRASLEPAETKQIVCPQCLASIQENAAPFCQKCCRPLQNTNKKICSSCQQAKPAFDRCWSALVYTHETHSLLHHLKYGRKLKIAKFFSQKILDFLNTHPLPLNSIDLCIPVPIHPARLRQRGFNQTEAIFRPVCQHLNISLRTDVLYRKTYRKNQARMTAKQRWTNVMDAFRIISNSTIINRNILIVDDLITTGATLSEAATMFKQAGALNVFALTAAIAVQ